MELGWKKIWREKGFIEYIISTSLLLMNI